MTDIENFDACTHPPGIQWTPELARAIDDGRKVRIVLEGRFTRIESRETAVFRSNCGSAEHPILQTFITFRPDWSDDSIELDTSPPWREA